MVNPEFLRRHLDTLTTSLEIPGADLQAMLSVLIDDITTAVPSFLGLRMAITVGGVTTTFSTVDPDLSPEAAKASLLLPLAEMTTVPTGTLILYAEQPGAFTSLAISTREAFQLDGHVVVDGHLSDEWHPTSQAVVGGSEDTSMINIAIGVLIDRGFPPDQASAELTRLAATHDESLAAASRRVLDNLRSGIGDSRSDSTVPEAPDTGFAPPAAGTSD